MRSRPLGAEEGPRTSGVGLWCSFVSDSPWTSHSISLRNQKPFGGFPQMWRDLSALPSLVLPEAGLPGGSHNPGGFALICL